MKFPRIHTAAVWFVMIGACGRLTAQVATPTPPAATGGPMIDFDTKEYNFGRAAAGEFVKHTFIVTNTGTDMLEIADVHPSCGCTKAGEFSHHIAAGQTGTIPIQFNSTHYSGSVTKTIEVTSNAKNQPRATLLLHGTVWKPIDVAPQTALISVPPDSTNAASATVRIVNNSDSAVTLSNLTSSSKAFSAELRTVKPGMEYELVVTVQPPFTPGNSPATISLKTSLASVPTLSVTAIAAVQQAVMVSPAQLTLSPSAGRWTTNRVFIRGNGTNALTLQDPQSSDSRIQLQIVQLGTRGMYNLLVAVPPDFEISRDQHVLVTVKSNHPRYPLITIPVTQLPRRAATPGQYSIAAKQMSTNGAAPLPHP
jgi:Protein of unknown function (DUF1573)